MGKSKNKTHGMSKTRIYNTWNGMKFRCTNKKYQHYKRYGGRGITYDSKWESFEGFYEDMKDGYLESLTLDRIDNNGNYCKNNCRWITHKLQMRNKYTNRIYKGKCIGEWAEIVGIKRNVIYNRINQYGWSIERALFSNK